MRAGRQINAYSSVQRERLTSERGEQVLWVEMDELRPLTHAGECFKTRSTLAALGEYVGKCRGGEFFVKIVSKLTLLKMV